MSKSISVNVFEQEGELLTDISECEADPGDVLVIHANTDRPFNLFFGAAESTMGEAGSTFGPFGPGQEIPAMSIPFDAAGDPAAAFHVMGVDAPDWPRILIRRPVVVGKR